MWEKAFSAKLNAEVSEGEIAVAAASFQLVGKKEVYVLKD